MNVYHSVSISVGTNSKFWNIPSNYLNSSKVWIVDKASYWFIYWEYTSTKRILDSIHFRQPKFNSSQWNWDQSRLENINSPSHVKSWNGLVMLAILKNPSIDSSHNSVASEIFLSLLLNDDPCLKNGTLKLFLGNF